ncbi:Short-chain-enoyl-CoA hydratase [compost metagenome]
MNTPELVVNGAVAVITLRRPEQANRLTPDDLATLADHIAAINATPGVLVLQLRGEGKYFCSGYDLNQIGSARSVNFEDVINTLEEARPITVAVLHGGVYGGATDLALACDFRIGVPGIEMFMPAARLGLHFYQRGLERYVTRLGLDNAKRLFLTAEKVGGEEMKAIGFLTHLVDAAALEDAAAQLAKTCASMAPIALLGMKRHLNRIARNTLNVAELQEDMVRAVESEDLREGQAAWAEKRVPRFTGK